MNKEIKFRTPYFDNQTHKFKMFSYWGRINHKGEYSTSCFTSPGTNSHAYPGADQQFTGSKDKNGNKELYDGDIITHSSRNGGKPHVVKWSDYLSGWIGDYGIQYGLIETELQEIEIIGNIHENPELLK
jgi:predicted DNA-binding WGR domain protein